MKLIVLLGRILFSLVFILAGLHHFSSDWIGYAASQGVPAPSILVPIAGIVEILGGLSILLGYKARFGAWLIVIFLIAVTFTMHKYWTVTDPQARMVQHTMFMKNLSMLGAALLITYFGSGPLSLDCREKGPAAPAKP
jgi:putative oxidoreductase